MNRTEILPLLAEIATTMDRVRDLDIEAHTRAAALHCLSEARQHLAQASRVVRHDSLPPGAPLVEANRVTRETATQAFRNARQILRGI